MMSENVVELSRRRMLKGWPRYEETFRTLLEANGFEAAARDSIIVEMRAAWQKASQVEFVETADDRATGVNNYLVDLMNELLLSLLEAHAAAYQTLGRLPTFTPLNLTL